jgi:hypothetical protein
LKAILAYCGYSPTSPFFLSLSEHKHCDNATTNWNSENARSRMVANLRGSVSMGTEKDESNTGPVWAAGFHHVTARSHLSRNLKLMNLFLFSKLFSGRGKQRILNSRIQGSACIETFSVNQEICTEILCFETLIVGKIWRTF